jgi:hypothetical protein
MVMMGRRQMDRKVTIVKGKGDFFIEGEGLG